MTGIEPALSAWEAEVLPLNYIPARWSYERRPFLVVAATPAPTPVPGVGCTHTKSTHPSLG